MHPHPTTLLATCRHCHVPFTPKQRRKDRYCTPACYQAWRAARALDPEQYAARFWARVNKDGPVPPHRPELGQCWSWTGKPNGRGYGSFATIGGAKMRRCAGAHAVSWALARGPVPAGLFALHHCDNRICVRPEHLFLGTHLDNMRDAAQKQRLPGAVGQTHSRGERNPHARLTAEAVVQIRQLHTAGMYQSDIARRYGVARSTIGYIVRNEHWRHLEAV